MLGACMFAKIETGLFAGRASVAAMAILFSTHSGMAADAIAVNSDDFIPPPDVSRFGRFEQKLADWHVVLGGGAIIVPKYEGSDEFKVMPVPFVTATFLDVVTINPSGASIAVYEQGPFELSARLADRPRNTNLLSGFGTETVAPLRGQRYIDREIRAAAVDYLRSDVEPMQQMQHRTEIIRLGFDLRRRRKISGKAP